MENFFAQQLKKSEQSTQRKPEQEQGNDAVASTAGTGTGTGTETKKLPKGVVLGKDGKPYVATFLLPLFWRHLLLSFVR